MRFIISAIFCVLVGSSFSNVDAFRRGNNKIQDHHRDPDSWSSESVSEEVHKHVAITCPIYNIFDIDISIPIVGIQNAYWWVDKLWSTPFPEISSKAAALRDVVKEMARSEVPRFRHVAATLTAWVWTNLPQIGLGAKPSLCGFAKIINATIASGPGQVKCGLLIDAMDDIVKTGMDTTKYIARTTKINAGCCPGEEHKSTVPCCYKEGEAYDSDAFWAIKGQSYPCPFQSAASALSRSHCFQDKFIGAVAHAVTTQPMIDFYDNFNKTYLYQTFTLQTIPKIEKYCCKSLNVDLASTLSWSYAVTDYARTAAIVENGCNY